MSTYHQGMDLNFEGPLQLMSYPVFLRLDVRIRLSVNGYLLSIVEEINKRLTVVHVYDGKTITLGPVKKFKTFEEAYNFAIAEGLTLELTPEQSKEVAEIERKRKKD